MEAEAVSTAGLLGFAVYCVVLAIVGVVLILWVYPLVFPPHVRRPMAGLTVALLVLLGLLRLIGVVTWPI